MKLGQEIRLIFFCEKKVCKERERHGCEAKCVASISALFIKAFLLLIFFYSISMCLFTNLHYDFGVNFYELLER